MKRIYAIAGGIVIACGGAIAIMAARFEERIRPNTFVGPVPVGDLTKDQAKYRLRYWWENEKSKLLEVVVPASSAPSIRATAGKLGQTIDDAMSIEALPIDSFWDSAGRTLGAGESERKTFELKFKSNGADISWLGTHVATALGGPRQAKVKFENGLIKREYEVTTYTFDSQALPGKVVEAFLADSKLELPLTMAPKKIPDNQLDKIKEVVSEFSTRFPAGQRDRNTNLQIASGKIDGMVLMPGEQFAFNQAVGQRIAKDGYRVAPVLRNGRHDTGLGGGICQVSGTLYNAVAYANLKVLLRNNHSLPSAYLALGRDCTVSWPNPDFKFQNNTDAPIAISRTYEPGKLTFRILGLKVPGQKVTLQTVGHRSWGRGVVYEHNPSLPYGKQLVVEKGSAGHAATVYRIVSIYGKEVSREVFNRSNYGGSPRIIAINKSAKPPVAVAQPPIAGTNGNEPQQPEAPLPPP